VETCLRMESSLCLMGMFSYSAALEMISIRPRILVLLLRDMLNSSDINTFIHSAAFLTSSYISQQI